MGESCKHSTPMLRADPVDMYINWTYSYLCQELKYIGCKCVCAFLYSWNGVAVGLGYIYSFIIC